MEALINDHQSQDLDVLLIQGPPIITYQTQVNHSAWGLYRPITGTDAGRFRSLIYVNQKVSTSSHQQIACDNRTSQPSSTGQPTLNFLSFRFTSHAFRYSRPTRRRRN